MFGLVVTAVALGLSNFGAAIAIGLSGVDTTTRLRVALVFGAFEAAMPVLGLLLGHNLAGSLGSASAYLGGGLLVVTGGYTLWQARHAHLDQVLPGARLGALITTGAAVSIDNLVVGFALGTRNVSLAVAVPLIAVVSVGMALCGLELGSRLGTIVEQWSEEIGGVVLILVGAAIMLRLF